MTQPTDHQLNTCDAPFGETFASYLDRQEQHQRRQAASRPRAQLVANTRATVAGDYTAKLTTKNTGHDVYLISKQHGGDWHDPAKILKACSIPFPFWFRDFCPIARDEATIKVHTD